MNRRFYIRFCVAVFSFLNLLPFSVFAQEPVSLEKQFPDIVFEEIVYDFGELEHDQKIDHSYKFENRGDALDSA